MTLKIRHKGEEGANCGKIRVFQTEGRACAKILRKILASSRHRKAASVAGTQGSKNRLEEKEGREDSRGHTHWLCEL